MTIQPRYFRRDREAIAPLAEICGQIHLLIEENDGTAGEVCEMTIVCVPCGVLNDVYELE